MRRTDAARADAPMARAQGNAASLGSLLEAFGPDAELKTGACLAKDVLFEKTAARLVAELRDAGHFVVRLLRDQSVLWEGETDLAALSNWDLFSARIARERSAPSIAQPAPSETPVRAWGPKEEALTRGLLPPIVGETWVMDVRVEDDDENEVRYRSINIGGEEYGAPRVLARSAFEETFVASQNGYRMLVRVLEVSAEHVVYQRISPQRELAGRARSCPMIVFLANFMPEAAAY
jgi:hypothetical protein